jgi:hypothetical protein
MTDDFEARFTAALEAATGDLDTRAVRFSDEFQSVLGDTMDVFAKAAEILDGFENAGSIVVSGGEALSGYREATVHVEIQTPSEEPAELLLAFFLDSDEPVLIRGLDHQAVEMLLGTAEAETLSGLPEDDDTDIEDQVIGLTLDQSANLAATVEDFLIRTFRDL